MSYEIKGSIFTSPSSTVKLHDLTMLYLKSTDISNFTATELAQKYTNTFDELSKAFQEQFNNKTYYN